MNKFSPENWEQAKAVFVEALEKSGEERVEYLNSACGDDEDLRSEVESLLRSFDVAGSFMEAPAVEFAATSFVNDTAQLQTGQQIKHYEIVSHIGEGGMGEVYLARDMLLGRRVALKFLPDYLRSDQERMRRFRQEARAASTLSHPNVCVIHEVSETEDRRPFITMEFIEGVTLRQRLLEGPLELTDALSIVIQISDALTAAHDSGVVHRDIKPENIMIRRDGYVKVLDFGLAKLTEHRKGLNNTLSTLMMHSSPGMVMGTAAYMSPEQARGVAVDSRSDVWSLGVVLYEITAGRAPFVGATPTDIVIAIVEKEQLPISEHVPEVPDELERIVRKALRKDPGERYQHVKEMGIDLRSLLRELELHPSSPSLTLSSHGTAARTANTSGKQKSRTTDQLEAIRHTGVGPIPSLSSQHQLVFGLLILSLVVLAGTIFYKLYRTSFRSSPINNAFQQVDVTKLTTNGNALFASISPDGKYVAYVKAENGKESLWLRQVGSSGNIEVIPPRDGHYQGLIFSPEGDWIYFGYDTSNLDNLTNVFKVPTLGTGAIPMKIDHQEGPAAFSHDGKRKAFVRYDESQQADLLKITNIDGSNEQTIISQKWPNRLFYDFVTMPAWTQDDQRLLIPTVANDRMGYVVGLTEVRLADRSQKKIPISTQRFEQPYHLTVLSDGSGVVLSGRGQGASFSQIWLLGVDGVARAITNDLSDYREADLTAKSDAMVTVQRQTLSNIFITPKADSGGKVTQITSGLGRYFDVSWAPDGKIVYASDGSGIADIYELSADGTVSKQLTTGMKRNYAPVVSPDNRYIAFHSNRSGNFQVWRMDRDGSNPVQLTTEVTESTWPSFSEDSKWIFYQHFEGDTSTIWKVPTDGGTPVKVVQSFSIRPSVSPDGKWLAFWENDGQQNSHWKIQVISLADPAISKKFEVGPTVTVQWDSPIRWSDRSSLTYIDQKSGIENLWAQSIEGGPAKQVTNFTDSRIFAFAWSRTGVLAASRGVISSDVVLITDKRK